MNKLNTFFAIFFAFLFISCNNEIDINADYEEIAVVYGLLNVSDSIQYVKVNKAFLSDKSVLEIAQISDSLYLPYKIEVILTQVLNDVVVDKMSLVPVEVKKEEGIFAGPNQLVYRTKPGYKLNPLSEYLLEVKRFNKNEILAKGKTNVISTFLLSNPPAQVSFYQNPEYKPFILNWNSPKGATSYTIQTRINYSEINKVTKDTVQKSIIWENVKEFRNLKAQYSYPVNGLEFYNFIKSKLAPDENLIRVIDPEIEFRWYAANADFDEFLRLNSQTFGFNTTVTNYSNVDGALGVFASRLTNSFFIALNNASIAELTSGKITGNLGFVR